MCNSFDVSVIIPVYNAEKYVERAINSALIQPEVREVIVVDDGHHDQAYEICQAIAKNEPRVKLFTHPDHGNKGAATSRNLGILNASCQFISFLDADDYFLPERFKFTKETFARDPKIEGVYEPVGYSVSTDYAMNSLKKIKKSFREQSERKDDILSYTKIPYAGKELFRSIVIGGNDGPHTDGVTIKKSLIAEAGLFNPILKLHQDTEYWLRLSYFGNLSPSNNHTQAVAIRDMHDENRTYSQNPSSSLKLWRAVLGWTSQLDLDQDIFSKILTRYHNLVVQANSK